MRIYIESPFPKGDFYCGISLCVSLQNDRPDPSGPACSRRVPEASERYTDAYAEVVEVVYRVGQDIAAVGGVAVVERHVETEAVVRTREDANADFGREVESPRVGVLLDYVVIGREFCIVGAQLQTRIGLEYAVRKPCVASRDAERQLERAVFLIDGQGRAVAQIERLARNCLLYTSDAADEL